MGFAVVAGALLAGMGVLWWSAKPRPGRRRGAGAGPSQRRSAAPANSRAALRSGTAGPAGARLTPTARPTVPELTLLDEPQLTAEANRRLEALTDAVPRPSGVLWALLRAGDDPAELARVVATDPAMAALLLRTVNSAQFGLSREITSVQHAITYLGANLVRDIAVSHAVAISPAVDAAAERVHRSLWASSYLASAVALAVAQGRRQQGAAERSTCALLFGLGDITLVSHHPWLAAVYEGEGDLPGRVDAVQRALGFNAAIVGARLGSAWRLPRDLRRALGDSLKPLVAAPASVAPDLLPVVALAYFACRLAETLRAQEHFDIEAGLVALLQRPEAALLADYLAAGELGDFDAMAAVLTEPAIGRRLGMVHGGTCVPKTPAA